MTAEEARVGSAQPLARGAHRELLILAIAWSAVLGGIALRWLSLERWSLWWDEGLSLWASAQPVGRILTFARSDNQLPLYYLLQHYWDALFGNSEFALRALSAVFGTLSLPVAYALAKKVLRDELPTAIAFWLFAFSLRQIWYSREAHAYEAASFFALVALCGLMYFLEKRSAWAFTIIVLSSALTLYLHSLMFSYFFAFDVVWLIYPSELPWPRRFRDVLLANVCVAILYLPMIVVLLHQVAAVSANLYGVERPTIGNVIGNLGTIAGFEVMHLASITKRALELPWPVSNTVKDAVGVGLAVLCGVLLAGGFWRIPKKEVRQNLCFLLYGLLPIFLVFLIGQRMPLYIDQVFTTSSIVAPIVFAFPLAVQKNHRTRHLYLIVILAIAFAATLSSLEFVWNGGSARSNENWRSAISNVLTIPETNRLVLFVPPAGEIFFDYYSRNFLPARRVARTGLPEDFHDRFPPPKSRIIRASDIDQLRKLIESHHYFEIDLVMTHQIDPHGLVGEYLSSRFVEQDDLMPSGPIRVIPFRAVPRP